MEVLVNFSQAREDIILFHALSDVERNKIFWIDVGANDPVNISVTLLASMMGGHGINIEPQIYYKERYDRLRSRDINLFMGIGERPGKLVLHGTGDTASMAGRAVSEIGNTTVTVITLDEVFDTYVSEKQDVHFLKIDVEGFEEECFKGIDLTRNRPWIILVECLAAESYDGYEPGILSSGYKFTYYDGMNRYYVREDLESVRNHFTEMDRLDELYEIISLQDATKYLAYESSTSWRITKPLRRMVSLFRKGQHGSD